MTTREIVLGPPGTGKTTHLIELVAGEMESGTPPDRIGYVSFTRRATSEAQRRMAERFKLAPKDLPWFRTIHSLCMRWLGYRTGQVMEAERVQEFAAAVGVRITGKASLDDGSWAGYESGDRMLFMIGIARVRRQPLRTVFEQDHDDMDWRAVERFAAGLGTFKTDRGLVDYTDMLEHFVAQDTAPRLDVLFVDEGQDLSDLQWDVIALLGKGARRVVVAGDDDQAIYRWAGGAADALVRMEGRVRVLGQSYRVPRAVQRVADGVISRVQDRRPKEWRPRDEEGSVRRATSASEAGWAADSTLVLARNRYQLEPVARELRASGVFFQFGDALSVKPALVRGIVAWERLRRGEAIPARDAETALELTSAVARGHRRLRTDPDAMVTAANVTGVKIDAVWHEALDRIPAAERTYLLRCRRRGERLSRPPRVVLRTIHGSKGGQADRVILLTDLAPRTAEEARKYPDDEARVFYVGATRARQELCIVAPQTSRSFRI